MNRVLTSAEILSGGALRCTDLAIMRGRIAALMPSDAIGFDLPRRWLLPGSVDLHGDEMHRIVMSCARVTFSLDRD